MPAHYIYEARAVFYGWKGLHGEAFYNWVQGGYFQNAHDTLVRHLIVSSESLDEKFADLLVILDKLSQHKKRIRNWSSQGQTLLDFVQARVEVKRYLTEFIDEHGCFKRQDGRAPFSRAQELDVLISRLHGLAGALKDFRVDTLSSTAGVVKAELMRLLLDWDTKLSVIKANTCSEHRELVIPNQRLIECDELTLNDKNNALTKFVTQTLPQFVSST